MSSATVEDLSAYIARRRAQYNAPFESELRKLIVVYGAALINAALNEERRSGMNGAIAIGSRHQRARRRRGDDESGWW
jgi:hypothetical protein